MDTLLCSSLGVLVNSGFRLIGRGWNKLTKNQVASAKVQVKQTSILAVIEWENTSAWFVEQVAQRLPTNFNMIYNLRLNIYDVDNLFNA